MNGRIDLKDGFCVSCGLESGVLYHSCPFCDEMVWHPLWRRALFWHIAVALPVVVIFSLTINSTLVNRAFRAYLDGSWQMQLLVALSAGLLLLPYENRSLIHSSQKDRFLWLLNSLAASVILLSGMLLFVLHLRFSDSSYALQAVVCLFSLTAFLVPLVLNCNWLRLIPALLFAIGLMFV